MRRFAVMTVLGLAPPAFGQTTSVDCVPPLSPMTYASPALLRDFGDEIRREFSDYFDQAQAYLNCLVAAQTSANDEINAMLDAHRRLFPGG